MQRKNTPPGAKKRPNKNKQLEYKQSPARDQGRSASSLLKVLTPIFPSRIQRTFTYAELISFQSGSAGIGGTFFYSANGMFDPDISGGGHQPLGFDELMTMYNHYTVYRSKISVQFIHGSGSTTTGACGIYLSPDTTNITAVSRLLENGLVTWKTLLPVNVDGSHASLSMDCDVASYYGRDLNPRELEESTDLYGTAAANPNDQVYFGLLAFDPTASNQITLFAIVEIIYYAFLWEPRKLAQS
jgi:hypothetical protein